MKERARPGLWQHRGRHSGWLRVLGAAIAVGVVVGPRRTTTAWADASSPATPIYLPQVSVDVVPTPLPTATPGAPGLLTVTFFDVGQGDGAWLHTPDGVDIVIDGGQANAGRRMLGTLRAKGVADIDVMVASHPDRDHIEGLIPIIAGLTVVQAVTNGQSKGTDISRRFVDTLFIRKIPTSIAREGHRLFWEGRT